MNELTVINEQEILGKQFRFYGTYENPLFLAKDVAKWIEHSDVSTMIRTVDDNEKVTNIVCTPGGNQEAWFLTEDGLYEVLMQSRKPIAKQFKREVKEILKTIRQKGIYATDNVIEHVLENPDFGIKLLLELKSEREQRKALESKIQLDQPKVIFADAVSVSKTSILVRDLAKLLKQNGIDTGEKRLYTWLRDNGYLIRKQGKDYNMPTQNSMEMKLFEIKETAITHSKGEITTQRTIYVTGKGQQYFINKFVKKLELVK